MLVFNYESINDLKGSRKINIINTSGSEIVEYLFCYFVMGDTISGNIYWQFDSPITTNDGNSVKNIEIDYDSLPIRASINNTSSRISMNFYNSVLDGYYPVNVLFRFDNSNYDVYVENFWSVH